MPNNPKIIYITQYTPWQRKHSSAYLARSDMNNRQFKILTMALCLLLFWLSGCSSSTGTRSGKVSNVDIHFIQLNDVYELHPMRTGYGGLGRVAGLVYRFKQAHPNTWTVLSGDFLSPTALNVAQVDGKPLRGRHMVDVFNRFVDIATFGNHEFDLSYPDVQDRLDSMKFRMVCANTVHLMPDGSEIPFTAGGKPVPGTLFLKVPYGKKDTLRIGVFGVMVDNFTKDYLKISPPIPAALDAISALRQNGAGIIVGLTHLNISQDKDIASQAPDVALLMGGHDHEHMIFRESGQPVIAKSDANAKSVYIHHLTWNPKTKQTTVSSDLIWITDSVAVDQSVSELCDTWKKRAYEGFLKIGFDPEETLGHWNEKMDGLESHVRTQSTNLTRVVAQAMYRAWPGADASIFNGGSIRVDDYLEGYIRQYDIIRTLPFGGKTTMATLKGSLLLQILESGEKNIGIGGYLHHGNLMKYRDGSWKIGNSRTIVADSSYKIVFPEFLLTGKETNLDYLIPTNPGVIAVQQPVGIQEDLRKIVIEYVRHNFPID